MRKYLALSAAIAWSLLAATVHAQMAGEEPKACVPGGQPMSKEYERDGLAEWPQEAQRFKSNDQMVSRRRDRLRLALDAARRSSWWIVRMVPAPTNTSMSGTTRPVAFM